MADRQRPDRDHIVRPATNGSLAILALFAAMAISAVFIAAERQFEREDRQMQEARVQW